MLTLVFTSILLINNFHLILSLNSELSHLEENLLYSHVNTSSHLRLFYEKILQSNDVDDATRMKGILNANDIERSAFEHKCFQSSKHLLDALQIKIDAKNDSLTRNDLRRILPVLAQMKLNEGCTKISGRASWKNIAIGLLAVTFINCSALCGAIILPFRKKPAFKWMLSVFIGLAVGTLTGSGIFHLIPMAFHIPDLDAHHTYLNKGLLAMLTIYIFYMRDQFLKIFFNIQTIICTHDHGEREDSKRLSVELTPKTVYEEKSSQTLIENLKKMKAAGWMILLGDMLHNFIDGLTLGAAFMVSIGEGLRMSFPIICEEFPHELGDIAVLLSSGLTIGQALIMNFLSACSCYLGFILGAKLGELEEVHAWVYALAGGMFVYIGLADIIPELVSMGDEIEKDYLEAKKPVTTGLKLKILFCQNSGLILGFVIMYLLGKYGAHLENLVKF